MKIILLKSIGNSIILDKKINITGKIMWKKSLDLIFLFSMEFWKKNKKIGIKVTARIGNFSNGEIELINPILDKEFCSRCNPTNRTITKNGIFIDLLNLYDLINMIKTTKHKKLTQREVKSKKSFNFI